jgi:hypothetical protein
MILTNTRRKLRISLCLGGLFGVLPMVLMWTVFIYKDFPRDGFNLDRILVILSLPGGILEPFVMFGLQTLHFESVIAMIVIEALLNLAFYSAAAYGLLAIIEKIFRERTS